MVAFNIEFLLLLIVSSVIGIQIAEESSLAVRIKAFLNLSQPYSKRLLSYGKFIFYRRLLGTASFILLPLVFLAILGFRLHNLISELLDCSQCTSFWVFALLLHFYLSYNTIETLIYAPLSIMGVYLIRKLKE